MFGSKLKTTGVTSENFIEILDIMSEGLECDPDDKNAEKLLIEKLTFFGVSYKEIFEALSQPSKIE
jgi:hypothetical protein